MLNIDKLMLSSYIVDHIPYGVYFVDSERIIVAWNKKAEEMTGFTKEEVVGEYCYDNILCHIDRDATPLCLTGCPLHATMEDGKAREMEVFLKHKKGHRLSVMVTSNAVYDDSGKIIGAVETFSNNSTKFYSNDLVDSLTDLVMTDKLTGLKNRRHIENVIESKMLETRLSDKTYGLIFLDLDDFSAYNNKFGHDIGDKMLKIISNNVIDNLRDNDLFGRWGGEEFVGVFSISYTSEIAIVAEKIRAIVEDSCVDIEDSCVSMTASLGATSILTGDTLDSVIARADALMYQSKQKGKNTVTIG